MFTLFGYSNYYIELYEINVCLYESFNYVLLWSVFYSNSTAEFDKTRAPSRRLTNHSELTMIFNQWGERPNQP